MLVETPAPSAPSAPAPAVPPAPNSLKEFREQRAASLSALTEPPAETPAPAPTEPPIAHDLDPPMVDEGDDDQPPQATQPDQPEPKGPEPAAHRWKDPDTGMTLDLRRRDHRRMKRLLEERADLARQVAQYQAPRGDPQERAPQQRPAAVPPDPSDPEPTLEQFADQPDPYLAHSRALARWDARQEFRTQQATHTRVERARQARAGLEQAQARYDEGLADARTRYPDFDDAQGELLSELGRLPIQARAPIVHRLLLSPLGHDLTHYLGSHPDDLASVMSARSAYEQGLVVGAIETRVRALVNQRQAPAPIHPTPPPTAPMAPVGGSASPVAIPDGSKMTLREFRAAKSRLGMTA